MSIIFKTLGCRCQLSQLDDSTQHVIHEVYKQPYQAKLNAADEDETKLTDNLLF